MSDLLVRRVKVSQWGNSAAVRLSAAMLERASLHVDDAIEVVASEDTIVIRRARPHVSLDDLLAKFDPARHRHTPMLDDGLVGTETE